MSCSSCSCCGGSRPRPPYGGRAAEEEDPHNSPPQEHELQQLQRGAQLEEEDPQKPKAYRATALQRQPGEAPLIFPSGRSLGRRSDPPLGGRPRSPAERKKERKESVEEEKRKKKATEKSGIARGSEQEREREKDQKEKANEPERERERAGERERESQREGESERERERASEREFVCDYWLSRVQECPHWGTPDDPSAARQVCHGNGLGVGNWITPTPGRGRTDLPDANLRRVGLRAVGV